MGPKRVVKMSLGDFLTDEKLGSWADEMEGMPLPSSDARTSYGTERRTYSSAPRMDSSMGDGYSDRRDGYAVREELPLPTQPPYTAHLGNMSFDTTQGDVNDFFQDCQVTNVRIVEDKLDRKPKGFGYVEFATLDGLKKALTYNGSSMGGRNVRISVADPPKDRQDGRDFSDWSRKGPLPDLPSNQRRVSERPGFQGRSFDNMSDAGSDRGDRGGRRGYEPQGDGKVRDFTNWERKGPLSPAVSAVPSLREEGRQQSRDGPGFRRGSPAWGEGRSQEGSRPPRRDYAEKPVVERTPTAADMDNQWRSKMRPDAPAKSPTPETSNPPSPAPAAAAPLTNRPKLNLQKRTVSEADPTAAAAPAADAKASPFGAARPVDTSAKEKEIVEKRDVALRQKREADEKAKAEKAEEKRLAKEKADQEKAHATAAESKGTEAVQEDAAQAEDDPTERAKPKFDILRRAASEQNDMVAADDEDEGAVDPTVEGKAVKPKEIVRDAPAATTNGAWRNKDEPAKEEAAADTAETMQEDGWSTVAKAKPRNNRRGNGPTRAMAS